MDELREAFVGIDVAKLRNAVAVADGGRMGEVRYLGEFDADEATIHSRWRHFPGQGQVNDYSDEQCEPHLLRFRYF